MLLPHAEQPQQQRAGQAAFPVGAALLALFADLLVGKGGRQAEPGSARVVCRPGKERGSTEAAGRGHLPWKGTEILCRESASIEAVWKAWLEEMRLAEVSAARLPSGSSSWPSMLETTFQPGHFSIYIQSVQQPAMLKSSDVTLPGPVLQKVKHHMEADGST